MTSSPRGTPADSPLGADRADAGGALERALAKARLRILPLLSLCYLVAYMDRANISFAAESMNHDLHFGPKVYGLGAGLFFVTYALCEIPSSRMLLRFGPRRWLARILLTWGLVAAAMVLVRGTASFYGLRMLLGVAEAGYFPSAVFYLSQWFPARERARSISWFYVAFPLSNLVMGALAGLLLRQGGRLHLTGWQWLFLVEALPALLLSAVVWFTLADGPAQARWLTADEREALTAELQREAAPAAERGGLRQALGSRRAWMIGLFFFLTLGSFYAITFSLPAMLGVLTGWDQAHVGYLVAGLGVAGALAMLGTAASSDKTGERAWHIVLPTVLMAVAVLIAGLHFSGGTAAGAVLVAMVAYYAMQGPLLGLPSEFLSGEAAATAIAMITMCGVPGGFVGPYFMGWMRETTHGYAAGLGALALPCLAGAVLMHRLLRAPGKRRVC